MNVTNIITEPCAVLRARARQAIKGKWRQSVCVFFVMIFCVDIIPTVLNNVFAYSTAASLISMIYTLLVSGPFACAMALYSLKTIRGEEQEKLPSFAGFAQFPKTMCLMLYMSVFIFLWALLFIIPGIIAMLRYSMSYYIMLDNPDKSIAECVNESKRIMKGNIGKLFLLNLSFIGWIIVAAVGVGIVIFVMMLAYASADPLGFYRNFSYESYDYGFAASFEVPYTSLPIMLLVIISAVTSLFAAPVIAYMQISNGMFYEILTGRLEGSVYKMEALESENNSLREKETKSEGDEKL